MQLSDIAEETKTTSDITIERKMTINAIMSDEFIKGVKPLLTDLTLIESTMCRTILGWAITYHNHYGMAMKQTIQEIYHSQRGKMSESASKNVADFLESISQQYAEGYKLYNPKLELDIAEEYLDKQSLIKLNKTVEKHLLTNKNAKAKQAIANFAQIKQSPKASINALKDFSRFDKKIKKDNVLFTMPYPFNEIYGDICQRHLSAVGAASKVGKSREMAWFACQALKAGEAIFIATLEMEEDEFLNLIDQEMLRDDLLGGEGVIPVFKGEGAGTRIVHKKYGREGKTKDELIAKWEALGMFNKKGSLHIKAWPQMGCCVEDDLIPELDRIREAEGVNITVAVIDYADLLKENKGDERETVRMKVAGKWRALKKLAQQREMHIHTASQLGKEGQLFESTTKAQDSNFIITLEQTPEEKRLGIYRQKVLYHRGIPYDPSRPLISVSNNGIGLFNLDARWSSDSWDHIPDDVPEDLVLWKSYTGEEWREELEDDFDFDGELQYYLSLNKYNKES